MMHSTCQRFLTIISILLLCICLIDSSRANIEEHQNHDQALAAAVRFRTLQQVLTRRGLYDPAYGDSWSNYFEKKRALFDPAYNDWSNSFKRSDE